MCYEVNSENKFRLSKWLSPKKKLYEQLLDYYDWCYNTRGVTEATMANKEHALRAFFEFAEVNSVNEVTNRMVEKWLGSLRAAGVKGSSINTYYANVKAMLQWMKGCDIKIPGVKVSRLCPVSTEPATRHFFTEETIANVLTYADRREWLLIKIAFDCGLRFSELQNLRLSNFTELKDGRYIEITGKGRKQRPCIMSVEAKQRLDDWIKCNQITDWIWPNRNGTGPVDGNILRKSIEDVFKKAGIKMVPHDLRRSYATDCKLKGATDEEIRDGLGHSSTRVTQVYLKQTYDCVVESLYERKYEQSKVIYR